VLARALALLAPPACAVCAEGAPASEPLCVRCAVALRRASSATVPIAGVDWAIAAAPYERLAGPLVAALKFRGRLAVAVPMAASIAAAAGPRLEGMTLVPVPAAPRRRRRRGFDPAEEIARALARETGRPLGRCLRRADGPRQVGRARRERLASPPRVRAPGAVPERAALVDDVVTTGATLAACAAALRRAGAREIGALAFARPGDPPPGGSFPRRLFPA
jgi:ComF family protein